MESGTGSTLRTKKHPNVQLEHGVGGGIKKHDIGQAPPLSTTTTEKYPIVKGKGHEACGAGGGDDDEGGKEDKTVKDDVYCPVCDKWFLNIQACRTHKAIVHGIGR